MDNLEIKRKKSQVVRFLLKDFLANASQLKFSKIASYLEDMVTFSDFKQLFTEPEVRKLVISVVVRGSAGPSATRELADFLQSRYSSLLRSSNFLRHWHKCKSPKQARFGILALRRLESKYASGGSLRNFTRNLFFRSIN